MSCDGCGCLRPDQRSNYLTFRRHHQCCRQNRWAAYAEYVGGICNDSKLNVEIRYVCRETGPLLAVEVDAYHRDVSFLVKPIKFWDFFATGFTPDSPIVDDVPLVGLQVGGVKRAT